MRVVGPYPRSIEQALGLGSALLARAAAEQVPWLAASVVEGRAIALGAAQRAGRVVDLEAARAAGVRVLRRSTSGTAAYLGGAAVIWTLALPHVAALVPDATPATLLNRNVRGFLKGLSRAGAVAHYFGREWIAVKHRPAALLGFDATAEGAVLIEVIAGLDATIAIPPALATAAERAVDRWLGKEPAALREVIGEASAEAIAAEVIDAVAARAQASLERVATPAEAGLALEVTDPDDPLPAGFRAGPMAKVPIGWVETAFHPTSGRVWLGGDVLAPAFALHALAAAAERAERAERDQRDEAPGTAPPIDGARVGDLAAAARAAARTILGNFEENPPEGPGETLP